MRYHITKYLSCFILSQILILPPALAQTQHAENNKPVSVVYQLYKDYGWEALFASSEDASKFLGKPLLMQSREVLGRYFDDELTALLLKEKKCVESNPGELCKLDFDPLFASQDSAASDLTINRRDATSVVAEFVYPADHQKIKIIYLIHATSTGWKISDIQYPADKVSLKTILK